MLSGHLEIARPNGKAPDAGDDQRLAAAAASGETSAFEEIYRRWGARMNSIAFHHLGNRADAEDAVQETLIKVSRSAGGFSGEAPFGHWLFRILVNTCLDQIRKRQRRTDATTIDDSEPVTSIAPAATVDEMKRITLRKMIDELPAQKRAVFSLFEIEGFSHAEIASMLDITEGNSKWILFATKKQLQQQWMNLR
jgi:RNA polymerase sigma-70 factor (ECF subfamily)